MKKILFALLLMVYSISAQEVLDKIAAVVDDEIILQSEVEFRTNMEATQRNISPGDTTLRKMVLNAMIEEKLLYAQAQLDSITVSDDQVKQTLENQISYFIQQYGSRERLEQVYGMPIEKIKRNLQDETKKSLMAQTVKQKKFGQMDVSRKEVEDFFNTYKDSLPQVQEKVQISHIFLNPKSGERIKKKAKDLAVSLLDSLKKGSDFAALAKKYSDDPGSAAQGGDLGTVKRGVFYPEFEAVAFALSPQQLSGVVESPVGYHIIQLLERRGEAIHCRHILIKVKSDDESDLHCIEFLSEVRDSVVKGKNTFEYYAKKYSDDKESAKMGGDLGTVETSQLDKSLLDVIYKLKEGDISYPKRLQLEKNTYGYHIVKLFQRIYAHKPSIDQDYDDLKRLTEVYKQQKMYAEWIKTIKAKIYWQIKS